jgi:ATP/maltotriose-dependent transcriptional regulator MalT
MGSEGGFAAPSAARLHPPRARSDAAIRTRLTTKLVAERPRVVMLVAPPGFGKTTLLAQWAAQDPRPFAWLLADEQDDDPTVLWTDIAAAIAASTEVALTEPAARAIAREPDPGPALASKLDVAGTELVLAVDEYAQIQSPRAHESLFRFIERAPPNVELAIASRQEPPLPLARLRANGEVLDLRTSDLRFTLDESERLLNETLHLALESRHVRMLHDRTEGWPAGLYLAHFGLRGARSGAVDETAPTSGSSRSIGTRFIRGFGASNRYVADYLNQEVLAGQDEETLEFMLRTSVVAFVSAPLADFLTDRKDSAKRLVALEHANVFIDPLDDNRDWYRYHTLLRELLLAELRRRMPDEEPALNTRASEWHEEHGDADLAVTHALAANDTGRAARLIGENYLSRLEWGRFATIESWLRRIGDDVVEADPRLGVAKAWTLHFLGRHGQAERALAAARRAAQTEAPSDDSFSLELSAAIMQGAFSGGDAGRMLDAAQLAYAREREHPSDLSASVHVLLGLALVRAGRFAEAEPYLARGEREAQKAQQRMDEIGARAFRARIALETGQPERAVKMARAAVLVSRRSAMESSHSGLLATAVLGAALVSVGRAVEAEAILTDRASEVRSLEEPFVAADFLLALGRAQQALGKRADADQTFDEVQRILDGMRDPGDLERALRDARRPTRRRGSRLGEELTERETEVLRLLASGLTARETAKQLFVTFNTVHSHVRTIYRKLGVGSRQEAVGRARELGAAPLGKPARPPQSPG